MGKKHLMGLHEVMEWEKLFVPHFCLESLVINQDFWKTLPLETIVQDTSHYYCWNTNVWNHWFRIPTQSISVGNTLQAYLVYHPFSITTIMINRRTFFLPFNIYIKNSIDFWSLHVKILVELNEDVQLFFIFPLWQMSQWYIRLDQYTYIKQMW